jgi:hypothetical protein
MERLEYDLWFVGLGVDDASWDQTTFGKNRDRLLAGDVAHKLLAADQRRPACGARPSTGAPPGTRPTR